VEVESGRSELWKSAADLLRNCREVETFVAPVPVKDWLAELQESRFLEEAWPLVNAELDSFRQVLRRWQGAASLPVDQMILTLSQDMFTEANDLALAHKLALVLRQAAEAHSDWRLPELKDELGVIARNERRFLGFSDDDSGFDPQRHAGKVVVTTMHKAKGLEWDKVYLLSVNNYDFPSGQPNDRYISEKWYLRDGLNLEAEALAQLKALKTKDEYTWYQPGAATRQARLDYVRERLRLLYVGLTRAKKELVVTWNTGRQGDQTQALPFAALQGWWESQSK
jgi:DNA helicase-2/ATP-dependent DNA helicase PcrA